jgi:hypothetical protein
MVRNNSSDLIMATNLTERLFRFAISSFTPSQFIQMYVWAGLTLPILYGGAFGNLLTLIVIFRSRWWKTGIQVLIASLTFADFFGTSTIHPYQLFNILFGSTFPWNVRPFCRFTGYITIIKYYLVPLHCCMIAINRFITIVLPQSYNVLTTQRAGIFMVVYCWALPAILFALPLAEVDGVFTNAKPFGQCTWAGYRGSRALSYTITFSTVYIPTVVIFVCYASIFIFLKRADRKVSRQTIEENRMAVLSQTDRVRRRVHVAKMMMVTFVVFLICYLPITTFFYVAGDLNQAPNPMVFLWLIFFFWSNGCCNRVGNP